MQREINFSLAEKQSFVERGMDETRIRKLLEIIGRCRDTDIEIFVYTKNSLLYEIIDVGEVNGEQIESVLTTKGNVKIKPDELDLIMESFLKDEYHISEEQFADVVMIELKKKKQF